MASVRLAPSKLAKISAENRVMRSVPSRGREQPTSCESKRVKVPLPSIARFRRLAYPTSEEATTYSVLGSKRHGCPVRRNRHGGRNDLGGKQNWRPEHKGMTAAAKCGPNRSRCLGRSVSVDPSTVGEDRCSAGRNGQEHC